MSYKIAIVGLGPKGLFAFERLVYEINRSQSEMDISIYIFDQSGHFGCGNIYNVEQPDFLLMNYPNRNIDVWPVGTCKEQIRGKSLTEFLSALEPRTNQGDEFSPRKTVGRYLSSCYDSLCERAGELATIIPIRAIVEEIRKTDGQFSVGYSGDNGQVNLDRIDQVLITSGHDSWKGFQIRNKVSIFNKQSDIPFIYPVIENFKGIPSSSSVAIKGLGLTFVDAVLGLTEGRAGKFSKTETGNIIYKPSSIEPKKILPFSKSGLPMIPRAATEGKFEYTPKYFTYDAIHKDLAIGSKLDFTIDILPLFIKETEYRYYKILIAKSTKNDLENSKVEDFDSVVEEFHRQNPKLQKFDFDNLFLSVTMERPDLELSPLAYYRYILNEAVKGSSISPFMAAALTWGKVSDVFNSVYSFGGLTAETQQEFDISYRSKLNRIAYGPPIENARKILALMENGILDMSMATYPEIRRLVKCWSITNISGKELHTDYMINARIPGNKSMADWSPLLTDMSERGLIREFINPGEKSYKSACPEIDRSGRAIASNGEVDEQLTFYGTPTEGMTYDNDTLSRKRNDFASAWALRCVEQVK